MRFIKQSWCAWMVFSVMVLGMTTALSANAQSKPMKHAKRIQLATGAALGGGNAAKAAGRVPQSLVSFRTEAVNQASSQKEAPLPNSGTWLKPT